MEVAVSHSGYSTCRWGPWDEEPCSTHTCGDRPGKVDRPSLKPLGLVPGYLPSRSVERLGNKASSPHPPVLVRRNPTIWKQWFMI